MQKGKVTFSDDVLAVVTVNFLSSLLFEVTACTATDNSNNVFLRQTQEVIKIIMSHYKGWLVDY